MTRATHGEISSQIRTITATLIEIGLCDDQNPPVVRDTAGRGREIAFQGAASVIVALKDRSYDEVYAQLLDARAFNVRLLDGALLQMMYDFGPHTLLRHRLAFFPSPSLAPFQDDPELYLLDRWFLEIVSRRVVTFPLRFDYDAREGIHKPVTHPKSHLTLGQYELCRIPVTAPVSPYWFVDFLLRNFYSPAFERFANRMPARQACFEESIHAEERGVIHLAVPGSARHR
jgi:hypothetical protein